MPRYDFTSIESRWQEYWQREKTFRTPGPGDANFDASKPKYYVLDMFPYPSGAGLHVGHPKGYTATDIMARYQRHLGKNVLHPMGWDAFGLPAEQYAIQTGTHPAVTTAENVDRFRNQLQALGLSYDWDREVNTTDPKYYRWTQWIFSKLYEQGLAYEAEIPVWWCEELGTVLANEEVIDGLSERGGHPCVKRPLRQWMLKITAYAERLLADLENLDWPESVKAMQREWIGRSEGAEIEFSVAKDSGGAGDHAFMAFTTRPDTLFGATFCVLAPEHPLVDQITGVDQKEAVTVYREAAASKTDLQRSELQKEKSGVFTGAHAINPLFEEDDPRRLMPIWIADYVLMSYGTGAIMCVPGGDQRDYDFATEYGLPVVQVVAPKPLAVNAPGVDRAFDVTHGMGSVEIVTECYSGPGVMVNSGFLDGLSIEEAKSQMVDWLEKRDLGRGRVNFRLRDWLFSRQRYWGEPFPILHGKDGETQMVPNEDLPVTLPELDDFKPAGALEPPLGRAQDWVEVVDADGKVWRRETNSMPQWAGSCWYYLRFLDPQNDEAAWGEKAENYWMPVDLYVVGAEHAVLHLLYARFWHKVLYDCGLVSTDEPFQELVNQGMVQSFAYKDDRGALLPIDEVDEETDPAVRKSDGAAVERIVAKMSKALRNVINPDDVIREYGSDTLRLYEAFMGPVTASAPWNPRDLPGVHRFLQRTWRVFVPKEDDGGEIFASLLSNVAGSDEIERALHRCIEKVSSDVKQMGNNTAIAAMMEFVNEVTKREGQGFGRSQAERFCVLLEPFAPHLAEELWFRLGHVESLAYEPWPEFDLNMLVAESIEIPVQVNGKLRAKAFVPAGQENDRAVLEESAREVVAEHLIGVEVKKVVAVPGRLVNFVVAS
ncbi:MAG: leucine--tRNA ligase [Planctomycetes bacterium]|nr:leucine--tRNA ligase [Planctomycetota bacterium]